MGAAARARARARSPGSARRASRLALLESGRGARAAAPADALAALGDPQGRRDGRGDAGLQRDRAAVHRPVRPRLLGATDYGSLAALVSTFLILAVPGSALQVAAARETALGRLGDGGALAATLAAGDDAGSSRR